MYYVYLVAIIASVSRETQVLDCSNVSRETFFIKEMVSVKNTTESENQFVVDLLTTLRQEKFSPPGWWCFFRRSWEMSCKTANYNPTLKGSWVRTTLLIARLAITIILIQNAVLPLWLGVVMLLRFCVPLLAVLGSYFLLAHPVRFGSTSWGKYAGLAQCLYFLVLLAPPQLVPVIQIANLPLLAV